MMTIAPEAIYDEPGPLRVPETPTGDSTPQAVVGSFGRNVAGTVLANLVTPIVGVASAPLLVHALGVSGRGEFAATTSPTLLLTLAGTLGLPEAVTYFIASGRLPTRMVTRRACAQSLGVGAMLVVVVFVLAPVIAAGNPQVALVMRVGALTLPGALLVGVVRGVAAGRHRWALVNVERGGGNLLRFLLVVVFAMAGDLQLAQATVIYLVAPVVVGVVYVPMIRSVLRESPAAGHGLGAESLLLSYGLRSWAGGLAGIVLSRLDQVLMTPLSNSRQLGLYAAAVAIAEVPYVLSGATRDVILAADAAGADDARAVQASRLTFFATLLFSGLLALTAPLLIALVYGSAFAAATPMLILLLLASVLYTPGMTSGGLLLSRGHPTLRSASVAAACLLNVILLPVLVPPLGGNGAALASVAAYLLFSVVNLLLLKRYTSLRVRDMLLPSRTDLRWLVQRLAKRYNALTYRRRT